MADNFIKTGDFTDKALEKSQEGFNNQEQPEESAVGRFAELVSASVKRPEEVNASNSISEDSTYNSNGPGLTLGDKILKGMQGLRDHVESRSDLVKMHLEPGEAMGMKEMFKTQLAVTNLMITEDYIGKIVSKSTQTFDTLLRNQ